MAKYRRHFLKLLAGIAGLAVFFKFGKKDEGSTELSSVTWEKKVNLAAGNPRQRFEFLKWKRLSSSNVDQIKSKYKVVVIGSGYGASVAAARVAEKVGGELCILERGREFTPGEYPRTMAEALKSFRFDGIRPLGAATSDQLGLFNVTTAGGMDVVAGNGLGGGSNINANVILEPLPEVFTGEVANINNENGTHPWPIRIEDLRPYFKKVRTMLKAERFRTGVWVDDGNGGHWENDKAGESRWRKNLANLGFTDAAEQDLFLPYQKRAELITQLAAKYKKTKLSASADENSKMDFEIEYPPLAVNLTTVDTGLDGKLNHAGVPQRLCNQCGDCVSGCNTGAKNTLIMNYIPWAKKHGAEIFTQMEVSHIEQLQNQSSRYRIHYSFFTKRLGLFSYVQKGSVDADHVIVGAGSLGSTRILLKSEKYGGFKFSSQLGNHFSGNSDALSAIFKDKLAATNIGLGSSVDPFIESVAKMTKEKIAGPCITTKVDLRKDYGIMFQDAAMPSALGDLGNAKEQLANMLVFLTMGYDTSSGTMRLTAADDLKIDLPHFGKERGYQNSKAIITSGAKEIGGSFMENPRIKFPLPVINDGSGIPVTVHALGGCSMGANNKTGVINSAGQVFTRDSADGLGTYPGLYVTCGAALPTSVGANPLLTISAFAERVAAYMTGRPDPADPQKETAAKYQVI